MNERVMIDWAGYTERFSSHVKETKYAKMEYANSDMPSDKLAQNGSLDRRSEYENSEVMV